MSGKRCRRGSPLLTAAQLAFDDEFLSRRQLESRAVGETINNYTAVATSRALSTCNLSEREKCVAPLKIRRVSLSTKPTFRLQGLEIAGAVWFFQCPEGIKKQHEVLIKMKLSKKKKYTVYFRYFWCLETSNQKTHWMNRWSNKLMFDLIGSFQSRTTFNIVSATKLCLLRAELWKQRARNRERDAQGSCELSIQECNLKGLGLNKFRREASDVGGRSCRGEVSPRNVKT